jgi:hypothetical protein
MEPGPVVGGQGNAILVCGWVAGMMQQRCQVEEVFEGGGTLNKVCMRRACMSCWVCSAGCLACRWGC